MKGFHAALLVLTAVLLRSLPVISIECYEAFSEDGKFPNESATKISCDNAVCWKELDFEVHTFPDGNNETVVKYHWGCSSGRWPIIGFFKCGEDSEASLGTTYAKDDILRSYHATCTCCDNLCNDGGLDARCNDLPKFTGECYSNSNLTSSDPKIESIDAVVVPITDTQSCFKVSRVENGTVSYKWGAVNIPTADGKCGYGETVEIKDENYVGKLCSCCGSLCNGAQMDFVTAESPGCESETTILPETTTVPSESTTAVTTQEIPIIIPCEDSGAVVGGVLGTFLGIAILVIAYLLYYISRLKRTYQPMGSIQQCRGINIPSNFSQ